MTSRKEKRIAQQKAHDEEIATQKQVELSQRASRMMYLKKIPRTTSDVIFKIPSRYCLRPNAVPIGCSTRGATLVWKREDLSIVASVTMWAQHGWKVRKDEVPVGKRSGQVGNGSVRRTWDVFGDWQVDRVRPDATMPSDKITGR
jgi:hypothetical protein